MGPKRTLPSSYDLCRSCLDQILDQRHELFRLVGLIAREMFGQEFGRFYRYRSLGQPEKPTRLMVGCRFSSIPSTSPMMRWCSAVVLVGIKRLRIAPKPYP